MHEVVGRGFSPHRVLRGREERCVAGHASSRATGTPLLKAGSGTSSSVTGES